MSLQAPHSIDAMARAGCTSTRGIRFWEEKELLGEVARSAGDTRRYTDEQLDRAKIIAAAQFGGWPLDDIKSMVAAYHADPAVNEALLIRLSDQARAAARLAESLPRPAATVPAAQEYDL